MNVAAPPPTAATVVRDRLQRARHFMKSHAIDALLIFSGDPHFSAAPPTCWRLRQWLSGFTGSAGTLVVTAGRAMLFTDSRYWQQAEVELASSGVELGRQASVFSTEYFGWLTVELAEKARIAVDGRTLSIANSRSAALLFADSKLELVTDLDLYDPIWGVERPAAPEQPVYAHDVRWADVPRERKLTNLRSELKAARVTHLLVSSLDDIAWVLNLRGHDLPTSPLFLAFLLIDDLHAALFVAQASIPDLLKQQLRESGIDLMPYDAITAALASLPAGAGLLVDPANTSIALRNSLPPSIQVIEGVNPIILTKARKTEAEVNCFRAAMVQDGAAMCTFYASFERMLASGARVTEVDVADGLEAARSKQKDFVFLSFGTVAAFNANGAIMHYKADLRSNAVVEGDGLLLIDSGGQYLGGTTDVTRMWAIGQPSEAQMRDVTLVLKSVVAMSETRFPRGVLSPMLDSIARRPLWKHGLDFAHATGHGVGFFLNVHEGPQTISRRLPDATMAMQPGMITSIEPGIYREGQWGVRIENLVVNVAVETPERGAFGDMLEFEILTLCPIDTRCLLPGLLDPHEVAWLNHYNAIVRERLSPVLEGDAVLWLIERTRPLHGAGTAFSS